MIDNELFTRILQKKKLLDANRPFDSTSLTKLQESFNVELTYNSNAIEGNTLSLSETKLVLEDGLTIGGKSMKEHLEATNHQKAIEFIQSLVNKKTLEEIDILNLHALILDRIDSHNAGFYRKSNVRISGTTYVPPSPEKVPTLMKNFYSILNTKGEPIEVASKVHMEFVNIHPFIDGNGRSARLILNLILIRAGYPPIIIKKTEREKYIRDIIQAQLHQNLTPFVNLVAKEVENSLDLYLNNLTQTTEEYLTLTQAAKQSKYSQEYISLLARKGKIGATKTGRNWKITKTALKEYEKKHK